MREKIIVHGTRCKNWVAIIESTQKGKPRQFTCRCLACGELKTVRVSNLRSGNVRKCSCQKQPPAILPLMSGTSCRSRVHNPADCPTKENFKGYCCYHCKEKECAARCKNTPDKCGSFYYKK